MAVYFRHLQDDGEDCTVEQHFRTTENGNILVRWTVILEYDFA